jgi:hypothetical protein
MNMTTTRRFRSHESLIGLGEPESFHGRRFGRYLGHTDHSLLSSPGNSGLRGDLLQPGLRHSSLEFPELVPLEPDLGVLHLPHAVRHDIILPTASDLDAQYTGSHPLNWWNAMTLALESVFLNGQTPGPVPSMCLHAQAEHKVNSCR